MIYIYWQSYFLTCCCPWTLCQCSSCQDESPAPGHVARVWLRLLRWFCICICFECSFCWPKAKPKQGIFLFVGCLFADVVVFLTFGVFTLFTNIDDYQPDGGRGFDWSCAQWLHGYHGSLFLSIWFFIKWYLLVSLPSSTCKTQLSLTSYRT